MPKETSVTFRVSERTKRDFYRIFYLYKAKHPDAEIEDFLNECRTLMEKSLSSFHGGL